MSSTRRTSLFKPARPRIAGLIGSCLLSLLALASTAYAGAPQAFDARYHLAVDGWPDADIEHRVSREGGHWLSEMHANVAVAGGNESSRFIEDGDQLRALSYRSNYRMLGVGKDYRLGQQQLAQVPDRQTALIDLARQAQESHCRSDCSVRFIDYKGREETMDWRSIDNVPVAVNGQTVEAPTIKLQNPDKQDRYMVISFHPEIPGLILRLDYFKHDEQVSRMSLSSLEQH